MKASKSPATESSDQTKAAKHEPLVYRVEEIRPAFGDFSRAAYNLCNTTKRFSGAAHRHQYPGKQAELRQLVCGGLREVIYGIYYEARRFLPVRYKYKDHSGKPCEGWESFKTKKEAQERKITVEKELLDGTFLVPDTMTVEEMLYKWIPIQSTKHKWSPRPTPSP